MLISLIRTGSATNSDTGALRQWHVSMEWMKRTNARGEETRKATGRQAAGGRGAKEGIGEKRRTSGSRAPVCNAMHHTDAAARECNVTCVLSSLRAPALASAGHRRLVLILWIPSDRPLTPLQRPPGGPSPPSRLLDRRARCLTETTGLALRLEQHEDIVLTDRALNRGSGASQGSDVRPASTAAAMAAAAAGRCAC